MKKTIIILSTLVIILMSCGQTSKKQTDNDVQLFDTLITVYDIDSIEELPADIEPDVNIESFFDIQKLDSINYFALKKNAGIKHVELEKLTDLELVKKMLDGRVIWGGYDNEERRMIETEEGDMVYKIIFDNGETISFDYPECFFIAYFPDEDILFLEGGHSSSLIYNLTTGEETETLGDPEYWRDSPSKQYRFNGYYTGQADRYFVQKKSEEKYETIMDLDYSYGSDLAECIGFIPEYIRDVFWQDDSTFNFIVSRYYYPEDKSEKFYYQLFLNVNR